jgi:uncharacterized membrane protein
MSPGRLEVLAQGASQGGRDTTGVFLWVGILIALLLVGFIVMMFLRKRMFAAETMDQSAGFMDSLREMRNSGQMSQEEFDAARKAMTARLAGVGPTRPASVKTQRPESG